MKTIILLFGFIATFSSTGYSQLTAMKGKADYKIYTADGRLAQEGQIDGQRINVASLIKGMYVITIKDDKNTYNTKLIKK